MKKRVICLVLTFAIMIGLIPAFATPIKAAGLTLSEMQAKYPAGKYWNGGNPNSYTSTPCYCHGRKSCGIASDCTCNGFTGGGTVSYNANGGSGAPGSQTKTHGTALTLSSTKPTRSGYTFLGWATSSTATSAAYQPGGSFTTNVNTTLYAVWKANTYTVSYNANGGSGAPGSQSKTHGTALTLSSSRPTRSGYTFLGWATSSSATSAAYQPGGSFTTNANTTLYAVWKANTYTVSYNANGGSGAPGSQSKTHGTALTLSSSRPTRSGYTFLGWATGSTATSAAYQPGGSFTTNANTTLYAVWKKGCEGGGHSYNYTTTKAPTTSATGTLTGTCSKCSGTTAVTLPKLDTTNYTYSVTKAATCTANGTGRYTWKTTSYGNFYFTATINSLGHNYSGGSCTRCGATDPNYVTNPNSPQIVVSQVSASAGSDVDVAVALKNNPGINTFTLKIQYDTSRLQLTGVTTASGLGGSYVFADNTATLTWLATADTSFNGTAFTLHFTVLDNAAEGDATVAITYQPGNICNYDEENVDFTVVAGCVSVQDYLPGDINGDGVVNNKDLNRLMKYLTDNSTTVVTAALDVNGDGTVNNKDLNRLMKYLTDNTVQIH